MPRFKVTWYGELSGRNETEVYAADENDAKEQIENRYYCSISNVEEVKTEDKTNA